MKPDWIINEPSEVYHAKAKEYLSSHQLSDFRKSPKIYKMKRDGLISQDESSAFVVGSAAHSYILEGPDVFNANYAVGGPINPKTGKPFDEKTKAFAEWAQTQDKPVVTPETFDMIVGMADSVKSHGLAGMMTTGGYAESVVRSEYCGVPCQIRIDYLRCLKNGFLLVDLKTCESLEWFEYDAKKYRYLNQVAFYHSVLSQVAGFPIDAYIIAVEKKPPYVCGVWNVSEPRLAECAAENEELIARFNACSLSDKWPTGYEDLRTF